MNGSNQNQKKIATIGSPAGVSKKGQVIGTGTQIQPAGTITQQQTKQASALDFTFDCDYVVHRLPNFKKMKADGKKWCPDLPDEYLTNKVIKFRELRIYEVEKAEMLATEQKRFKVNKLADETVEFYRQMIMMSVEPADGTELTREIIIEWPLTQWNWFADRMQEVNGMKLPMTGSGKEDDLKN